jgi:hypothetical protein
MAGLFHVTAKDFNGAGLDLSASRDETQKRGFSDPVRADQRNSFTWWNDNRDSIKRDVFAITEADFLHPRNTRIAMGHWSDEPCSHAGHLTLGSTRT